VKDEKITYWVAADFHFNHWKIMEYQARPDDFEDRILKNLIDIEREDVLIYLGDFCIGEDEYWHDCINALGFRKYLILGNHDRKSQGWYMTHGWDCVCQILSIKLYGKNITFSHRPIADTGYDLNIHGHMHGDTHRTHEPELREIYNDKQVLIKMEHDYRPIKLRRIVEGVKMK